MMIKRKAEAYLQAWLQRPERKPLIIRGARQVGKTYLVSSFGHQNFAEMVTINLEKKSTLELFKTAQTIEDFIQIVETRYGKQLNAQTLIFIDEIQELPHLVSLLRFFYEEKPEYPIICTGSLFEAKLQQAQISMPVGRVEFLYLYPLDFFEFLGAMGATNLLTYLQSVQAQDKISPALHQQALDLLQQYSWVGGMPAAVNLYRQQTSLERIQVLDEGLLTTYIEDTTQYETVAKSKYLQFIIQEAPKHAGQQITYAKFGNSQYRSREMSQAFNTLEKVMLVRQILATQSRQLPLMAKPKRAKKLLFLDVGLVNYQHQIDLNTFSKGQLENIYQGRIAEQLVGQQLLAQATFSREKLFYWSRNIRQESAEVDFCFNLRGRVVGVEVKAGTSSRLRSLFSFGQLVEDSVLVRVYSGPLCQEEITIKNQSFPLLSVPFYLVPKLKELLSGSLF